MFSPDYIVWEKLRLWGRTKRVVYRVADVVIWMTRNERGVCEIVPDVDAWAWRNSRAEMQARIKFM